MLPAPQEFWLRLLAMLYAIFRPRFVSAGLAKRAQYVIIFL